MADIKETLEIYNALDSMTKSIAEAMKDGKLNIMDIPSFVPVLPALWKAIKGMDKIAEEIKDLDDNELKILTMRSIQTITDFIDVMKKVKETKHG